MSTAFLLQWQAGSINNYRRAAKISYPQSMFHPPELSFAPSQIVLTPSWFKAFAEKAEVEASKEALIFNCAQREFLEFLLIPILQTWVLRRPSQHAGECAYCCDMVCFHLISEELLHDGCPVHSTLVTALRYPIYATATCSLFTVSRVMYTIGYLSGEPKKVRHWCIVHPVWFTMETCDL